GAGSSVKFHEQLRLQQQYGNGGGAEGWEGGAGTFMDTDGSEYEWDCERGAWFPRITEDFLAAYQANYGFNEEGVAEPGTASEKPEPGGKEVNKKPESGGKEVSKKPDPGGQKASAEQPGAQQKGEKRKVDQGWIDVEAQRNTSVYVSGLPPDMSLEEFIELMSKFGIIMRDPETEECKIKLYKDKDGNLKGDGLCCYLKKESVSLALKLMDETDVRGHRVRVEPAKFEMKGQYDASKKKKKSKDYRKKLLWQKKQLDWKPEKKLGEIRLRHQRVVVIKNMFHPKEIEEDALVLNEIREDLRVECEKFGQVKKVLIFDRHPDGVASVAFKEVEEADQCIQMLNGRWFAGRQIIAEAWDGQVDYQIEETVREREERLKSWSTYLDQDTSAVQSSDVQKLQHASSGVSEEVPAALEGKSSAQTSESKGTASLDLLIWNSPDKDRGTFPVLCCSVPRLLTEPFGQQF
uniref:17S U2 SnRNP complex component HTATSF1 n=1 Tax=Callorhinchus milii TaxID=7868 RepID=A0A4W3GVA5_CALMI